MPRVSAILISRNEEENIDPCLESLGDLCDEIIVVDDHSTDATAERARARAARVFTRALDGFGPQKQFALDHAAGEWVLSIDADERLTPALREEIRRELAAPRADGYEVRREVYYLGRRLRFGGMERDRVLRLFRRERGRFSRDVVHERVELQGTLARLRAPLEHHTHQTVRRHLEKIRLYSPLAAEKAYAAGRHLRPWTELRPLWEFFSRYLLRLGLLDGSAGLRYAALSAYAAWLRARRLREIARAARPHRAS
jgi:glycosyltransferase involved in cell wall biosynthesis